MKIIWETDRTILRSFDERDLNILHELHTDPQVMKYLVGGIRKSKADSLNDLTKYIRHEQEFGFGKWAIVHKDSSEFMGRAGLVFIPETREIDFGYAFHQNFWNQEYATEVAYAMLEYHKKHLANKNLIGLVKTGNEASARVLTKIGFKVSGIGNYFGETFSVYRP